MTGLQRVSISQNKITDVFMIEPEPVPLSPTLTVGPNIRLVSNHAYVPSFISLEPNEHSTKNKMNPYEVHTQSN